MAYILRYDLLSVSAPVAVLIATLPLTLCARFFSVYHKAPVTVFLLPGIFPLVPGAGIDYTAYYFLRDDPHAVFEQRCGNLKNRPGFGPGHCAGVQFAAARPRT